MEDAVPLTTIATATAGADENAPPAAEGVWKGKGEAEESVPEAGAAAGGARAGDESAKGGDGAQTDDVTSVRVAVRVRPLLAKEHTVRARECIEYVPGNATQVVLGGQRSFTYDYVFGPGSAQEAVTTEAVAPLIDAFFEGYNATVLAYGQTGSGKTYTMGSGSNAALDASTLGVIPRVITAMYERIEASGADAGFRMRVSFLEIHNENIVDLFNPAASSKANSLAIREADGAITVAGITEVEVGSGRELLDKLERGSIARTTASTLMNSESSRSHAIFSLILEQVPAGGDGPATVSKFHFVDLAGSERLKRTKAVGDRLKEGININCGLLALGNVISALGDPKRSSGHIPYRDSKLTRLLQDSLGGNSRTLMIACVSPADINFEETLNTLRYADRARKIKNKPIVNVDLGSAEAASLRAHIKALQTELALARGAGDGARSVSATDMAAKLKLEMENEVLQSAYAKLQAKVKALHETVGAVTLERDAYKAQLEAAGLAPEPESDTLAEYAATIAELKAELGRRSSGGVEEPNSSASSASSFDFGEDDDDNVGGADDDGEAAEAALAELETAVAATESHHAAAQNVVAEQVADLDRNISLKEELLAKVVESKMKLNEMKEEYEARLASLHTDIAAIEADKAAIERELASMKSGTKSGSVQVRKSYEGKLRKLNKQLKSLQEHKVELERLQRVRAKEANRMEQLQSSISEMKRARIALVRKQRDDAKSHAAWKAEQKRKMAQLVAQKRKDEAKLKKQERALGQQKAVTRRKMEELSAVRQQLKSTEARGRAVAATKRAAQRASAGMSKAKPAWGQNNIRGMPKVIRAKLSGLKRYFDDQFASHVAHAMAVADLEAKLAKRASVAAELAQLDATKAELEAALAEVRVSVDADASSDELYAELADGTTASATELKQELATVIEDIEGLEAKLEFEAAALSEAQNEVAGSKFVAASELSEFFDVALDERLVRRVERLSGHECRAALEYAVAQVVAARVGLAGAQAEVAATNATVEDKERMLVVANTAASAREAELVKVQSEYEDKVLFLLEKVGDGEWSELPERSEESGEHGECAVREEKLKALLELKSEHLGILQNHNADLKGAVSRHKQNVEDLLATSTLRRKVLQQVKTENIKLQARVDDLETQLGSAGVAIERASSYVSPQRRMRKRLEESDVSSSSSASESTTSVSPSPPPPSVGGGYAAAHAARASKKKGGAESEEAGASASGGRPKKKVKPDAFTREACCGVLSGHSGPVYAVAAGRGYDVVYSAGGDKLVKMWDAETGKCIESLHGHTNGVEAVLSASGHVFSGGRDKTVRVWDPSQQYPCTASIPTGSEVSALALADYTLYAALANGAIKRFDVRNMSAIKSLPSLRGHSSSIFSLALSSEDSYLVAGYRSHHVGVFDLAAESEEVPFVTLQPPHYDGVTALALHAGTLYSGSKASNIKQWRGVSSFRRGEAKSGISSRIITSHPAAVTGMIVADDVLHSADKDGNVQFWDLQAEQSAGGLVGAHNDGVLGLAGFGMDHFVTCGGDRMVKLWRVSFS